MPNIKPKANLSEFTRPESIILPNEEYFLSIKCDTQMIHWAMHSRSKNLLPTWAWKTQPLSIELISSFDENIVTLAHVIPSHLKKFLFGGNNKAYFTKDFAEKECQSRGYKLTYYIICPSDSQARYISKILSCVPSRGYLIRRQDFFPELEDKSQDSSNSFNTHTLVDTSQCAYLKAAMYRHGLPALVIHADRSRISYSATDSNGTIMGGGISPGLNIRWKSCHHDDSNSIFGGDVDGDDNDNDEIVENSLPRLEEDDILQFIRKSIDKKQPLSIFTQNVKEAMVVSSLNEIAAHLRSVINLWLSKVGSSDDTPTNSAYNINSDRIVSVTGVHGEILNALLQPNFGGMIESSYHGVNEKEDSTVSWENSLIHVGFTALLKQQMSLNDSNKQKSKYDVTTNLHFADKPISKSKKASKPQKDALAKRHIGKRVAKYFDEASPDGDHYYRGTVNDVNSSLELGGVLLTGTFYYIIYDDSDTEHMSTKELKESINLYKLIGEKGIK